MQFIKRMKRSYFLFSKSLKEIFAASPRLFFLLLTVASIAAILPVVFIKSTADIINILSHKDQYVLSSLYLSLGMWIVGLVGQNILAPCLTYIQAIYADKLTYYINSKLIQKSNAFESIENFDNPKFYDQLELLKTQSSHKPINLLVTLVGLFKDLATLIGCFGLIYSVLGISSIVMLIVLMINAYLFMQVQSLMWSDSLNRSAQSRFINYLSSICVNNSFIKDIRFYGYKDHINNLFAERNDKLYNESKMRRLLIVLKSIVPIFITISITAVLTAHIVTDVYHGNSEVSSVALLIQALIYLQITVNGFAEQSGWLKGHLLYFDKYFDFCNARNVNTHSSIKISTIKSIIFKGVSFAYSGTDYKLVDINFSMLKGEKIAIVGENGAGKSTFIKLLCALYKTHNSEILINGNNILDLELETYRTQLAPVFQDFVHYDLTLRENISITANESDIIHAMRLAQLEDMIDKLDEKVGKAFGGIDLSVGQWQKVAIARAICSGNDFLILDEPTASLDPLVEHDILENFVNISQGKTVIFVTHRLNSILFADKVLVLDNGKILDFGPHDELKARCPKYKEMITKQASSYIKMVA